MFIRAVGYLWGDLSHAEIRKFTVLSGIFFLLIGAYWLLRTQKDAVFDSIVGLAYQPRAKILSWFVSIILVLIYSKLLDLLGNKKLLLVLATFFGSSFMVIAYCLEFASFGFADVVASPDRIFGWVIYVLIESLGSLMVGLFWAFVTSTTDATSAKKGYPLVIVGSQCGSLLGSYCSWQSEWFGNAFLFGAGACALALIVPMVFWYVRIIASHEKPTTPKQSQKPKTGIWEGLRLLLTRPYVGAILIVSTIYEVITTVLEYEMKLVAKEIYVTREAFASFNGMYGMFVNGLALLFALIGTSFLMRRFGLRFCLLLFPIITAFFVGWVYFSPVLYILLMACMATKGLSYAMNNPAKEMMYIPTVQDVRFKAKGWIDQFGGRTFKGLGAAVNDSFRHSFGELVSYSTYISFGLIAVWLVAAAYVGSRFKSLTEKGEVID
ncbi:MAG: antiporter, family [Candidatus Dependentiae bacterium]|nr:antiporter, family [Candidatus Dependentiae bacterium]